MERRAVIAFLLLVFSSFSLFFGISCLKGQEKFAEPLENRRYFPFLVENINSAKTSVSVVIFESRYYKNYRESKPNEILDALVEAAKRGVDVKVIIEGGEAFLGEDFAEDSMETCIYLRNLGVDARLDPKNVTTHAKLVVIDQETVIIGSTNWNYYAIEENNEASVAVHSAELSREFERYFQGIWEESAEC